MVKFSLAVLHRALFPTGSDENDGLCRHNGRPEGHKFQNFWKQRNLTDQLSATTVMKSSPCARSIVMSCKSSVSAVGLYPSALSVTIRCLSALVAGTALPSAGLPFYLHVQLQYNYAYAIQITKHMWCTESYWPIGTAWNARRPKSEMHGKYNPRPQQLKFGLSGHFLHICTPKHTVNTGRPHIWATNCSILGRQRHLVRSEASARIQQQPWLYLKFYFLWPRLKFPQ